MTSAGRARQRQRICARNVSSCRRSCFVMVGCSAAHMGAWPIGVGSPARSSSTPARQIVLQDAVDAIADAAARLRRLDEQLLAIVPSWSMAPVVAASQAMRGVSFIVAVTFVAEIGDVRRFDKPRRPMAFLGLLPSARSTGERVRPAGLTLAANRRARRVLVEGAWTSRCPARVSETLRPRLEGTAEDHPRPCLEGSNPSLRPLSPAHRYRQEDACGHRRDRPRNGGISPGHRPPRRPVT